MKSQTVFIALLLLVLSCDKQEETRTEPPFDESENPIITPTETQTKTETEILNWFNHQQMSNGLLQSIEDGNVVSLYDNALASLVYILEEDYESAELVFDFFNARINSELKAGPGGFSQLRDSSGTPNNHRWMGDNAWLLIAINNYKAKTGSSKYDILAREIKGWLLSLQDSDGGLFAGYDANNQLLNYKVTEGMIDAFNAIEGYASFHNELLHYLEVDRWDEADKNLVAWPGNPQHLYALDLHPWSYMIFKDYPLSSLRTAERYITSQSSTATGEVITGYCFDEDQDVVWFEGTAQMTLAFDLANLSSERDFYLAEMEKNLIASARNTDASGFPYSSNMGTHYGGDLLWNTAHTEIAISGGAWYIFTKRAFNPFAIERNKAIPQEDMFWLD